MALVPLNLHAVWRPWQQAGLPHLLLEDDAVRDMQASLAERRQAAPQRPEHRPSPSAPPVVSPGAPNAPQRPVPGASRPSPVEAATPSQNAAQNPAQNAPHVGTLPEALPPETWPETWVARLHKTPPRPRLVWTYGLLAQDLAGMGDGRLRGEFFRGLFAELGMPQGSHALWPLNAAPHVEADPLFFISGVQALNPETLVFMGEDDDPAFVALGFPRIGPLSLALWRGRRFVRLHGVDLLREDSSSRRQSLLSLLKSFHRPRG